MEFLEFTRVNTTNTCDHGTWREMIEDFLWSWLAVEIHDQE